ncbi:MAG: hypothetical protein EOM28_09915 [Clostridia bacterium]|nr:hypothetical protein [Clostridia bacterium]
MLLKSGQFRIILRVQMCRLTKICNQMGVQCISREWCGVALVKLIDIYLQTAFFFAKMRE